MNIGNILDLFASYCKKTGRTTGYISMVIVRDAKFYSRIKGGGGCTVTTYNKVITWFSANWPEGLDWPADIERPDVRGRELA